MSIAVLGGRSNRERLPLESDRAVDRGDEHAADQAAVDAIRQTLSIVPIDGTVVIAEGERDQAPMLFVGEKVGTVRRIEGNHRLDRHSRDLPLD